VLQGCRDPVAGPGSLNFVAALVAANVWQRDNGPMRSTPAERKRLQRARAKAGETVPTCSLCGTRLLLDLRQRQDRQDDGLCWGCWLESPAGQAAERERAARARQVDPERTRALGRERARRLRARRAAQAAGGQVPAVG
jgi:hypothetical protein